MTTFKHIRMKYTQKLMTHSMIFKLLIIFLVISCEKQSTQNSENSETPESILPNILLVIADDMGKDATPNYDEGESKPQMPTLRNLMSNGVTFVQSSPFHW